MKILAIDLGGTSAKIGLVQNGKIIKRWNVLTKKQNVWGNIKSNLHGLNMDEVDVIGLSVPGFINYNNNIIALAENIGWKDYDVKADFAKYFDKPVYILNDANAAALGEYWIGSGKKYKSIIFYTIGTGIGGGIIINGNLIYGKDGFAGEFGHGGNFQSQRNCACGLKHCVEPMSSATGILRSLREGGYQISIEEAGNLLPIDKKIRAIFKDALEPLGSHISVMEMALNPEAVIIGGGPSNIGEPLRQLIEEIVNEKQLSFIANSTKIVLASTKNDAGIYGSAFWALKNFDENK